MICPLELGAALFTVWALLLQWNQHCPGCSPTTPSSRTRGATCLRCHPDLGLVVADVSVVHPAAQTFARNAPGTNGIVVAARNQEKPLKYGLASRLAAQGFTPLATEACGRMGAPVHAFVRAIASAAASFAEATTSAFMSGGRVGGSWQVHGNEITYREALRVFCPNDYFFFSYQI